ncbi:cytochrome P450 [Plantactinospora sp. CA-294935]|uniref:cytochrome P450 n=1 Tax=Plantactinospora sp. CA-294935 TaxID=3240012 RepID=UPI003D8BC410
MTTTAVPATGRCPFGFGTAASLDLIDPGLYAHRDPHPIWQGLREHDPVHWQQAGPELGFWSVTRYADVDHVLRRHDLFTSEEGSLLTLLGRGDPAGGRQIAVTDPPRHSQMRDRLQRAMTKRSLETHDGMIRAEIRQLLGAITDNTPVDVAALLTDLPMAVTGTLMGVPRADWPRLTRLTTMAIAPDDPEYALPGGPGETLREAHRELFAYFQDLLHDRRRAPGEDLISRLIATEVDGRPLGSSEIVSNCYSLILGANTTTPHVPVGALVELDRSGGYRDWARRPELLASGIEEALRWVSPANHFMRHATRDTEIAGVRIGAGEPVVAWLGSANRDERVFDRPHRFDVRRKPNRHIAFGAGPHYCIGHTVARATLRVLFAELFDRIESYEVAGEPQRLVSNFIAGYKHLTITARLRGVVS